MNDSEFQEKPSQEEQLLKAEYQFWHEVLETKGNIRDGDPRYQFLVDRREEPEAFMTADEVYLTDRDPSGMEVQEGFRTFDGEEWISIDVSPRDPYDPNLAIHTDSHNDHFYTERLYVLLSNFGRGYQFSGWEEALPPNHPSSAHEDLNSLKRNPKAEELQTKLEEEPIPLTTMIEPFQPLSGDSLERLEFLKIKLQQGQVIEGFLGHK